MGTRQLQRIATAELEWRDGAPVSSRYGDIYFSTKDGLAETEHVFIDGNRLPERWQVCPDRFIIAETGFGSGLNFLATCKKWLEYSQPGQCLHYVAVEQHPLAKNDLELAIAAFPSLQEVLKPLLLQYPPAVCGFHHLNLFNSRVCLTLAFMDISQWMADTSFQADAWFLDGFAPSANQSMWAEEVLQSVSANTAVDGSFATFTAASAVRKNLQAAGFIVEKVPGFGDKRESLRGVKIKADPASEFSVQQQPWYRQPTHRQTGSADEKTVSIIGAGLAGVFTAASLAQRGWQVNLIDANPKPAAAASGNPAAVIFSKLSAFDGLSYRFNQQAYVYSATHMPRWLDGVDCWSACGMLQLAHDGSSTRRQRELIEAGLWPEAWVRQVSAEEASSLAGLPLRHGGLFFPQSGWIKPRVLCEHLLKLNQQSIRYITAKIARIEKQEGFWLTLDSNEEVVSQSKVLVLASAYDAACFSQVAYLPLKPIRGQISQVQSTVESEALSTVLCHEGYIIPAINQQHCLGATFDLHELSLESRMVDNERNLTMLSMVEPRVHNSLLQSGTVSVTGERVGVRCHTVDYMPVVGPVPDLEFFKAAYAGLSQGQLKKSYPEAKWLDNLYVNVGHGSRGVTSAPLAAEIIAAYINSEAQPVSEAVRKGLHPARFLIKAMQKNIL